VVGETVLERKDNVAAAAQCLLILNLSRLIYSLDFFPFYL